MSIQQLSIEADGQVYAFRCPTARDMVDIDIDALRLRQGITDGVGMAQNYSRTIAMLNKLCTSPESADFGAFPSYVTDQIGDELVTWLQSFKIARSPAEDAKSDSTNEQTATA